MLTVPLAVLLHHQITSMMCTLSYLIAQIRLVITNHVLENFVVTNHIHENFVIILIKSLGGEMENEWLACFSTDQKIQIQDVAESICCALQQNTLFSQCLSPTRVYK